MRIRSVKMFDVYQWKRVVCEFCHHESIQEIELGAGSFFAVVACPHCKRIVDAMILDDVRLPDV